MTHHETLLTQFLLPTVPGGKFVLIATDSITPPWISIPWHQTPTLITQEELLQAAFETLQMAIPSQCQRSITPKLTLTPYYSHSPDHGVNKPIVITRAVFERTFLTNSLYYRWLSIDEIFEIIGKNEYDPVFTEYARYVLSTQLKKIPDELPV